MPIATSTARRPILHKMTGFPEFHPHRKSRAYVAKFLALGAVPGRSRFPLNQSWIECTFRQLGTLLFPARKKMLRERKSLPEVRFSARSSDPSTREKARGYKAALRLLELAYRSQMHLPF
jgi:hypothetical protein